MLSSTGIPHHRLITSIDELIQLHVPFARDPRGNIAKKKHNPGRQDTDKKRNKIAKILTINKIPQVIYLTSVEKRKFIMVRQFMITATIDGTPEQENCSQK